MLTPIGLIVYRTHHLWTCPTPCTSATCRTDICSCSPCPPRSSSDEDIGSLSPMTVNAEKIPATGERSLFFTSVGNVCVFYGKMNVIVSSYLFLISVEKQARTALSEHVLRNIEMVAFGQICGETIPFEGWKS